MILSINSQDQLLDDQGKVLGPIFDTIANRPDLSMSDVQKAYNSHVKVLRDAAGASDSLKSAIQSALASPTLLAAKGILNPVLASEAAKFKAAKIAQRDALTTEIASL